MLDIIESEEELELMSRGIAAVFRAPIRQYPQQWDDFLIEKRDNPVIEEIGGIDRMLAGIQLRHGHGGIRVDEGLLVDASDPFDVAHVVGVLGTQIAHMLGLDLAKGHLCQCRFKMSPFCRNKMSPDCRFHSERFSGSGCSSSPFGEGPNMPAFRFSLSR